MCVKSLSLWTETDSAVKNTFFSVDWSEANGNRRKSYPQALQSCAISELQSHTHAHARTHTHGGNGFLSTPTSPSGSCNLSLHYSHIHRSSELNIQMIYLPKVPLRYFIVFDLTHRPQSGLTQVCTYTII